MLPGNALFTVHSSMDDGLNGSKNQIVSEIASQLAQFSPEHASQKLNQVKGSAEYKQSDLSNFTVPRTIIRFTCDVVHMTNVFRSKTTTSLQKALTPWFVCRSTLVSSGA